MANRPGVQTGNTGIFYDLMFYIRMIIITMIDKFN